MEEKVFHFQDRKALTLQCDDACANLYENFLGVISSCSLVQDDPRFICLRQQLLQSNRSDIRVTWFARYGAAILAQNSLEASQTYITVVGLDGWKSKIHSSQIGREVTAIPDLADPAILDVGWIPKDSVQNLVQLVNSKLEQTERQHTRYKNHKTPSFVWSKILDVMVILKIGPMTSKELEGIAETYQGGTTDVGLHTGCLPRNTSFPLVASVISAILTLNGDDEEHGDFYTVLSAYYLHHLRDICNQTTSYDRQKINRGIVIIREIRRVLLRVKDDRSQELVVNTIDTCHQHLTSFQPKVDTTISSLSPESLAIDGKGLVTAYPFPVVPCLEPPNGDLVSQIIRARSLAKRNLQWSKMKHFSWDEAEDLQQTWLGLEWMNRKCWEFARALNDDSQQLSIDMETIKPWLGGHDSAIEALLNASQDCIHVMSVELKSLSVLASWIAFCWAHRIATEHYPAFGKYSAALDPTDLNHLVLQDKGAIDAAREVRVFLEKHRQSGKVPFRNHEDTLDLALAIGTTSSRYLQIYSQEHTAAMRKMQERHDNILETQKKLEILDAELAEAGRHLAIASRELSVSERRDYSLSIHGHRVYTETYYNVQRAKAAADERVNTLQRQVLDLDKKPVDVFFPLPSMQNKALQWLFFLFMPSEFLDVTSFAHRAQSKLWNKEPPEISCRQELSKWYNIHRTTAGKRAASGTLIFGSSSTRIKSPLEPRFGIRQYVKESGIFFPDSYNMMPTWEGGDPFDPCYREEIALNFTESLPMDTHLQQYLVMSPSQTRGNMGIATKNEKPDWLSHEEHMMFTSLRAFPNLQFRQLLVAMIDDNLPFEHKCVHILVRQLLYQVGDESWKTDLTRTAVLDRIAEQLNRHAGLLQESSNNASRLLLFGTIASYLGQFDQACLLCSRRYTRICRDLADQVQLEIQNNEKVSPDIYWKQAKLYGCALLSHSNADRSKDAFLGLGELMVLFRQKRLLASDASNSDELDNLLQCVMAPKISSIISTLEEENLTYLNEIVRLIIDDVPSDMPWSSMLFDEGSNTACFEASESHHYSVNLLNGNILCDGVPPGFLPSSVMDDELYKRTFGSRNFECVVEGDAHYRTAKPVGGHYRYDFKLVGDELIIFECDRSGGNQHTARSLDSTTAMSSSMPADNQLDSDLNQGDDGIKLRLIPRGTIPLPPLLLEPYSHWYSEKHKAVFIRDAFYRSREVRFVMTFEATYCVPASDISLPIPTIMSRLDKYERLVRSPPPAIPVLSRIEESQYILPWVDQASSCIRYSLPRLHLDFCQMSSKIASVNFDGFVLRESQTLEDVLPGVTSYLVLVDPNGKEIVLIPCGEIYDDGDISVPQNWDMKLRFHTYRIHRRFRHLMANDDLARLQLAGMYAAASCHAAQSQSTKTGMQMATELVRQCWTNEKLSPSVKSKLIEVSKLSGFSCSLRLVCAWIWASSDRLSFLREAPAQGDNPLEPCLELDPLAVREYREREYREVVLPNEESLFLASRRRLIVTSDLQSQDNDEIQDFVAAVEKEIWENMVIAKPSSNLGLPFPLDGPNRPTDIDRRIQADLMSSWDAYSSLEEYIASQDHNLCFRKLQEVKQKREDKENMCLNAISANDSVGFRLRLLAGYVRSPSTLDLLCIVLDENHFQHLNPALSGRGRTSPRTGAVEWMILCVLEDKLRRILEAPNNHMIKEETRCLRGWDPWSHLRWLAFEVEQQIQIRPYQYSIVQQLLDDPRSMTQLNMGLGKTSVLIPMLILELTKSKASVIRVNMLTSIIDVMKEKYKSSLTASIQHVKIFALPFQRSFPLDLPHEQIISEEIQRCKKQGGCMLVTPQHRNSLLLKQYDSDLRVAGLTESFIDIFDESDAVLHHSFQLVYAVGKQKPLVDGRARWNMVEVLLQILAESGCPQIASARNDPDSIHCKPGKRGEYPSLRVLPPFKQHQKQVGEALCKELIKSPPYVFRWMKCIVREEQFDLLVKLMTRSDIPAFDLIESDSLFQGYKSDILAARGCIAYGLLFYCLGARNRVDYGVDNSRKKMAVPFSASDTPKARADFSHPDVAIIYSCLVYFNEGLTKQQLKDAILRLQRLGPSVHQTTYRSWINAAVGEDPSRTKAVSTFDSHLKVDAENDVQLEAMFPFFRRSMKVISFWLNEFVFPVEMHVVPGRRVTSAWNLVDLVDTSSLPMNNAIGVSGTDDNRFLLPTFVRQKDQAVPELRATNAQMIDCILKCTNSVVLLQDDIHHSIWETVLHECIERGTRALIDVGGLMAGVSNKDAAKRFSGLLSTDTYKNSFKFKGVVYYNASSKCWDVFDLKTRACHRLETSSLQAADCFVYYDESRCRGHDLQLKEDACALVTLESGLTKDKFLQGCARMRQLRPCGQSVILGGTCETLSASDDVRSVLEKIMKNTANEIRKGTVELLGRGKSYAEFPEAMDIDVSLQSLYSGAKSEYDNITDYAEAVVEESGQSDILRQLAENCKAIGVGGTVKVSQVAEECEQELENEEEAEEEMEVQMTAATPYKEQDWNYEGAFMPGQGLSVPVIPIAKAILWLLGSPLANVCWSTRLLCTKNWMHTISASYKVAGGNFLRPVNAFLLMPDGRIVLISDYEANKLLPHWWRCMDTSKVKLGHISFVASKTWLGGDKDTQDKLDVDVWASAKLLHGYVHYEPGEMGHLITMFSATNPRNAIVELLQIRHRLRFLERSDLDEVLLMSNEGREPATPSKGGQFDDCESPGPPRETNGSTDDQFANAEQPPPPKRQREM